MISEWSAELTLTEESSKALFDVLHQQDQEFIDGLLEGKHGFTLQSSDGRSVELVPAPKWIPCSERLPTEEEQDDELGVLVTLGNGYSGLQYDWYHDGYWYDWNGFVVAWMPLPEPYCERSNR